MSKRQYSGRAEMRRASLKRRKDARALLENGPNHARGAMYLGGYAVECKVKAIAMEAYRCWTLEQLLRRLDLGEREVYSHKLEALVELLPSYERFKASHVYRDFASRVNQWRPEWRYDGSDPPVDEARKFLEAVDKVTEWLNNNN